MAANEGTPSRYWLGCSGWAYDDWVGPFYPRGTPPKEFLERYARVFRTVEVDSSFYRAPSAFLVRRWTETTPPGFRFCLKVPREATHAPPGAAAEDALASFGVRLAPMREAGKLGAIVLQFPASFRRDRGSPHLERLLALRPAGVRCAVELRHASWWTPETRGLLERHGAALVWSVLPTTAPPPWVTGDFLYARFVGDRALARFDRVQRAGRPAFEEMRARFEDEGRSADVVFAYSNNHFMGFAPASARELAEVLGAPAPRLALAGVTDRQATLDGP